jgi:hypothetical protein
MGQKIDRQKPSRRNGSMETSSQYENMLEQFTYSTFQKHINEAFRLYLSPEQSIDLKLVTATDTSAKQPTGCESFSIVFLGSQQPLLPQDTYLLQHPELGEFQLFIVPIRQDKNGSYYEAVFSRIP